MQDFPGLRLIFAWRWVPESRRIRIPPGRRVRTVQLLAGNKPQYRDQGGSIGLEVPSVALHEVVAVDLD